MQGQKIKQINRLQITRTADGLYYVWSPMGIPLYYTNSLNDAVVNCSNCFDYVNDKKFKIHNKDIFQVVQKACNRYIPQYCADFMPREVETGNISAMFLCYLGYGFKFTLTDVNDDIVRLNLYLMDASTGAISLVCEPIDIDKTQFLDEFTLQRVCAWLNINIVSTLQKCQTMMY